MTVQPTSRRALLKGAAILTAVPVAALGGVPVFDMTGEPEPIPSESPVLRIYREWEVLQEAQEAAYEAVRGQGMDSEDAAFELFEPQRRRIEQAILAAPASDLRDLAAKMIVLSGEGTWCPPDALILQCATIVGRDFAKLPRCLFEEDV